MSSATRQSGGREPASKRPRAVAVLAVAVLAVAGVVGIAAYLQSRDDATLKSDQGIGRLRTPGGRPVVRPGNVLLLYSDARQATGLRALGRELGGSDAALAKAGQAVLVQRAANQRVPVMALSARHRQDASTSSDPAVRRFVEYWLGRAAG